ncbi:SHOCT domain-containing protein [Ancylobacter defluvii]|uniref:SHOCT domain-containing protein n=1 Tax=Ancylobacter defluvii TaxID=1282440 RepID=A0A9W6JWA7_9HYPH|nr:SHOCT domain-containing protein [Ancylobacter defluvii]MBS7586047.1 SHOCT domain-containing protein [Ancylobacter defluvii]GLK84427.1 hypothetical protein GCM10017653_24970 [Ancylobacter defluvii]
MTDASSTEQQLNQIADANGVSTDAARTLFNAICAGGGRMAQFSHPELGGMGQWSFGGMLMIGDMFNNGLKAKVDRLCHELSDLAARQPPPVVGGGGGPGGGYRWWPEGLGNPSTTGAQNDMRYAFFPSDRRLVISQHGVLTVYDTDQHMISGVSQQQGGSYNLSFSSQFGQVDLASLRRVPATVDATEWMPAPTDVPAPEAAGVAAPEITAIAVSDMAGASVAPESTDTAPPAASMPTSETRSAPATSEAAVAAPSRPASPAGHDDIFDKLERLGELRKRDILTEAEFLAKKTELLARL